VTLNVNGREYVVAAGDVIKVAHDDKTTCQVALQSFDMFKAALNAMCSTKSN
jgi:hypothetical protein